MVLNEVIEGAAEGSSAVPSTAKFADGQKLQVRVARTAQQTLIGVMVDYDEPTYERPQRKD